MWSAKRDFLSERSERVYINLLMYYYFCYKECFSSSKNLKVYFFSPPNKTRSEVVGGAPTKRAQASADGGSDEGRRRKKRNARDSLNRTGPFTNYFYVSYLFTELMYFMCGLKLACLTSAVSIT